MRDTELYCYGNKNLFSLLERSNKHICSNDCFDDILIEVLCMRSYMILNKKSISALFVFYVCWLSNSDCNHLLLELSLCPTSLLHSIARSERL